MGTNWGQRRACVGLALLIPGGMMASIEQRGGRYRLVFRHGGQKFQHPLKTADRAEADACRTRLEEGIRLLERGRIDPPPPGADLAIYLLSDGKLNGTPQV